LAKFGQHNFPSKSVSHTHFGPRSGPKLENVTGHRHNTHVSAERFEYASTAAIVPPIAVWIMYAYFHLWRHIHHDIYPSLAISFFLGDITLSRSRSPTSSLASASTIGARSLAQAQSPSYQPASASPLPRFSLFSSFRLFRFLPFPSLHFPSLRQLVQPVCLPACLSVYRLFSAALRRPIGGTNIFIPCSGSPSVLRHLIRRGLGDPHTAHTIHNPPWRPLASPGVPWHPLASPSRASELSTNAVLEIFLDTAHASLS
jgi:hypothetical protein